MKGEKEEERVIKYETWDWSEKLKAQEEKGSQMCKLFKCRTRTRLEE